MTSTEAWLAVSAVLAGIGALVHLLPETAADPHATDLADRHARPWQVFALARALIALAIAALAIGLAVSPAL